jgi:hypothetical protein
MAEAANPSCEVHGEPLAPREVRIVYGLIRRSPKVSPTYLTARRRGFPHCDDVALGGCVVREPRTRPKGICPTCCQVRDDWLRQHCPTWAGTHDPSGL